ncbi:histidine phosphatase family protein [Phytohabitans sp. LJ34]|uniref:histidine phosphatase family protein n=1 Tax=Phytohabitans sp. LJ34 TaxID=3452217 RepID=UPI003F8A4463
MRIVFIRHGETDHNAGMVITSGSPGGQLTQQGVGQIRRAAELLSGSNPTSIYSSPLLRAAQSAEIIAERLGIPVVQDNRLRECDVGDLEGRSDEASFARFSLALERWFIHGDLDFELGPGGESGQHALERFRMVVTRILESQPADATVVVVSHQTLLQLALTYMSENLVPAFGHRRWMANGGASLFDVTPERTVCVEWDGRAVAELLAEL